MKVTKFGFYNYPRIVIYFYCSVGKDIVSMVTMTMLF